MECQMRILQKSKKEWMMQVCLAWMFWVVEWCWRKIVHETRVRTCKPNCFKPWVADWAPSARGIARSYVLCGVTFVLGGKQKCLFQFESKIKTDLRQGMMTLYLNAQHRNTVCVLCNLNTKNFYYITYIQINDIFVFNICEQKSLITS